MRSNDGDYSVPSMSSLRRQAHDTICWYNSPTVMGAVRFNVPHSGRPVSEVIARLPRSFRDDAEKGFIVLASVPERHYDQIVQSAIIMMESRRPPVEELKKALGLTQSEAGSVFSAAMVVVPLFDKTTTVDDFFDAAIKTKLIDASTYPKVKPFVDRVASHGSEIASAIKKATLSDEGLPSFMDLDVTVDLRIGFEEGRVDVAVPIALIHIDTDAEREELWFQCSKQQLLLIKDDIEAALKKMDAAEAWGSRS